MDNLGVGLNFDGELKFQKSHKKCQILVIDPDKRTRALVMVNPKNRFVEIAASDIDASNIALMKQGFVIEIMLY
jgi:hypothetical protein